VTPFPPFIRANIRFLALPLFSAVKTPRPAKVPSTFLLCGPFSYSPPLFFSASLQQSPQKVSCSLANSRSRSGPLFLTPLNFYRLLPLFLYGLHWLIFETPPSPHHLSVFTFSSFSGAVSFFLQCESFLFPHFLYLGSLCWRSYLHLGAGSYYRPPFAPSASDTAPAHAPGRPCP